MNLYELVTTENVDLNYKVFKKDELIDCILNLSDTYFTLKEENERVEQLKEENKKLKSIVKTLINEYDLKPTEYVENLLRGEIDEKNN